MSFSAKWLLAVALVIAAGCAGPARPNHGQAPNWESGIKSASSPASRSPTQNSAPGTSTANNQPSSGTPTRTPNGTWSPGAGTTTWIPVARWARETGAAVPGQLAQGTTSYALRSPQGTFVFQPGRLPAQWDGLELRLGFTPQWINDEPFVHTLDLAKTIQPLMQPGPTAISGRIVIDPGHGGTDCGARSVLGGGCEKDYTLDWALRLRNLLASQGWDVALTRSTDTEFALSNRVTLANEQRAALFVSLHFNSAAPNTTESGLETYCLTPAGMASSLTRSYADDANQAFPNNAFDAQNLLWAVRIHRSMLETTRQQDRGVRRARFPTVLRGQQCPAVLVEGGYLSNPEEARRIADPAHRQRLAEALARALQTSIASR